MPTFDTAMPVPPEWAAAYAALRARYPLRAPATQARNGLALLRAIAKLRGGQLLSKAYTGHLGRQTLRCAHGHEWETTASTLIRGAWCPHCYREALVGGTPQDALDRLRQIARAHGGECLDTTYRGSGAYYHFRCQHQHEWRASASAITQGSWCARCYHARRAEQARLADGLERLQQLAAEKGGVCLSKRYINGHTRYRFRCAQGHTWQARGSRVLRGAWCAVCHFEGRRLGIEAMQQAAAAQGGLCLSTHYVDTDTKLEWQCQAGHRWWATPAHILLGTWCGKCVYARRSLGIEAMRAIAAERGGQCLSAHYTNAKTKLEWLCHKGHRWCATPDSVQQGKWCPECARLNRITNRKSLNARLRGAAAPEHAPDPR